MRRIASILCTVGLAIGLCGATSPVQAASDLPAPVGTGPQIVVRHPMPGTLTQVRLGEHASYDRIVFQIQGNLPGWDVRYVSTVYADPSGKPVAVAGNAVLRVVLTGVREHDSTGRVTATGLTQTPRWPALTQMKPAGDFEAVVTFAIGVTDRLDFRVFGLTNPTRVVVDVAHPVIQAYGYDATQFWAPPGGGGDFTLGTIRTGGHPGFDRIVFDLPGRLVKPNIGVWYAGSMDGYPPTTVIARFWTFTYAGSDQSAVALYSGPRSIRVALPNVGAITVKWLNPSNLDVMISTRVQHGYRAFLIHGDRVNRLVIDIAR